MNGDDRIRRAFEDLEHRTGRLDPRFARNRMRETSGPARLPRWVPALAGAAVVVAVIGGVALLNLLPGESDDGTVVADDTTTTTTTAPEPTPSTTVPETTTTTEPAYTGVQTWFRVDTERVSSDTSDPFLNVRQLPEASAPISAKLPPTYAGVRWAGESATSADGGTWYLVELVDPVPILNLAEPLEGRNPTGYVNAAFLEPTPEGLPVTSSELAPCIGESEFGGPGQDRAHVSSLRAAELGSCTRIVVGFSDGDAGYLWDGIPANVVPSRQLPTWFETQSPWPLIINLPNTTSVWPGATDTDGVYVVRDPDGSLSIVVLRPAAQTLVRTVPERGLLVIDLTGGNQTRPPVAANVVLTRDVMAANGTIDVVGIARPFEANLEATIADNAEMPVEALFSGSTYLGTIRTDAYGVQTNDWLDAWGRFAIRAEGLRPGTYTLALNPDGGSDDPRVLEVPFIVDEPGETPTVPSELANDLASQLIGFAMGGPEPPALAGEVSVRLGNEVAVSRTRAELSERAGWIVDADVFNGWSGPFDLLQIVAGAPNARVSEGPIPHCANPPIDWWSGADLATPQINFEPVGITSCLEWYAVSLRLNPSGVIQEVVLDLWEP